MFGLSGHFKCVEELWQRSIISGETIEALE